MNTKLRYLALLTVVLLFALAVMAQVQSDTLNGTVTDPSGAVVPNAQVTVTNANTGLTRTTTSASNGAYTITNLPAGIYNVRINAAGFGPFTTRAKVSVGGAQTVDAHLALQASSTTVEVVGAGGVEVNTENQTISTVVTGQEVTQLPTLTRNPYDLVATAGNVSQGDPQNQFNRGAGYNINGQRSASTDILLDGGENVDLFTSQVGQTVPIDSVQEFRVVTSDFTAQYGRASGGVVNVATKSGTNAFHGTAYEFNRISALAANTYENDARLKDAIASGTCTGFDDPTCPGRKGVFTRNQFGLALGGPIAKDKLFFFANGEGLRVRSQGVQNLLVPTPQFIAASAPATQAFFNAFGTLAHPINGKILTVADINNAGPLLSALPASTPIFGVSNFAVPSDAGGGNPQNTALVVGRVDFNMTDKTTMFGRYSLERQINPPGVINFSPYTGFDTGQRILNNNAMFALNHIFGTNFVSQTRLVYNRLNLLQPLGAAPVGPTLYMNPTTQQNIGGVAVAFPGYNELTPGNAIPFGGPQNLGQVYEDLSWTKGAHNFKFGGQFIYTQDNRAFGAYEEAVEALATSSGRVGTSLDNFLRGQLGQFQAAVFPQGKFPCRVDATGKPVPTPDCTVTLPVGQPNFSRSNRYKDSAVYVQDSWKMFPTFTVNLGVRWEYYGVQHNKDPNLDSNFYLGSGSDIFQQIANGSVQTTPNAPIDSKSLWAPDYNNVAPRVGFAWDLFGNGKTSLRGGYGISYERNFGNVTFNTIQNPPNYAVLSLLAGSDIPSIAVTTSNAGPLAGTTGSKALPRTSLRAIDENLPTAYAHMWSMSFEREVVPNTVFSLAYTGSRGVHQYVIQDPNRAGSAVVYLGADPAINPLARMNNQYTNINRRGANGSNSYNGLNVGFRTNWARAGLSLNSNYTWSHAIDQLSTTFSESNNQFNLGLLDPFNPALDKGSADYDVRHRVAISAVWDLPFARNSSSAFWRNVIGGFSFAPIFEAHTGTPFTIWDCTNAFAICPRWDPGSGVAVPTSVVSDPTPIPTDVNLFNILPLPTSGGTIVGGGNLNDVNPLFGDVNGTGVNGIADFGPSCTTPGSGALARCVFPSTMTHRNAFRGPSWWNFTLAGYKTFKITERLGLQLRAEAFNIFNHHNFYVLGTTADVPELTDGVQAKKGGLGSASFLGAAADERRNLQLAVKVTW